MALRSTATMTADPSSLVGREFPGGTTRVERWAAFLWATATRNPDPTFRYPGEGRGAVTDDESGDSSGRQYAPPTYAQVVARAAAGTGDVEAALRNGNWADPSVFLGGLRFAFDAPLVVGRTYRAEARVGEADRKSGSTGPFTVLTVEYDVTDEAGDPAFGMETDLVVRHAETGDGGGGEDEPGDGTGSEERGDEGDGAESTGETGPVGGTGDDEVLASRTIGDVDPADMRVVTAIVADPNPMHFDPRYVERQGYPGRVNQGPVTAAYAAQAALAVADAPGDLRRLAVQFDGFVFEGDTVEATAVRDSGGETGDRTGEEPSTDLALAVTREGGERVLSGAATVRGRSE